MATSKIVKVNEKIAENVVGGYKKIENGVIGGYKKIENGVVSGYKKIEDGVVNGFTKMTDGFVERFLTKDGESVEEAKQRMEQERLAREAKSAIKKETPSADHRH